jgi:N-acetylmuramic acid 6-phosphate etherase
VANSPGAPLPQICSLGIVLDTGAEPLTGSTRLKAGTSQKILLNTLSTAAMVRLGKVYENLMVDVVATNSKLRKRALRLVMQLASIDDVSATEFLRQANGSVKTAVVMACKQVDAVRARALLEAHAGSLRASLS